MLLDARCPCLAVVDFCPNFFIRAFSACAVTSFSVSSATWPDSSKIIFVSSVTDVLSACVAVARFAISDLSSQVALLTEKLATAQAENARMKKSGQQSTTAGQVHRASRNTTWSDPNPSQYCNLYSRSGQRFDPNRYCSSHRYKVEELHTSATCRFPGNGHNKSAT